MYLKRSIKASEMICGVVYGKERKMSGWCEKIYIYVVGGGIRILSRPNGPERSPVNGEDALREILGPHVPLI